MLFEKIIPLYTIWNIKTSYNDVLVFIILFAIYIVWIIMNKQYINKFINNLFDLIIYKKNTLPAMILLEKMGL
jgi:hypothetical protein